jgi:hypothetical protein
MRLLEKEDEKKSKELYVKENIDYISQLFGEKIGDISEIDFVESPQDHDQDFEE